MIQNTELLSSSSNATIGAGATTRRSVRLNDR